MYSRYSVLFNIEHVIVNIFIWNLHDNNNDNNNLIYKVTYDRQFNEPNWKMQH